MNTAYGFLEVRGLVAGIECADAMLKAASVRLATQITTNPALITLVVEGDIGSCRAAIDAGRLAAQRMGSLVSEKVIGRPEPDLALFVHAKPRWNRPAAPEAHSAAAGPLTELLNYLASTPNGKRLDQLAQFLNLPDSDVQTLLNTALQQGRLKKNGSRYLIP